MPGIRPHFSYLLVYFTLDLQKVRTFQFWKTLSYKL